MGENHTDTERPIDLVMIELKGEYSLKTAISLRLAKLFRVKSYIPDIKLKSVKAEFRDWSRPALNAPPEHGGYFLLTLNQVKTLLESEGAGSRYRVALEKAKNCLEEFSTANVITGRRCKNGVMIYADIHDPTDLRLTEGMKDILISLGGSASVLVCAFLAATTPDSRACTAQMTKIAAGKSCQDQKGQKTPQKAPHWKTMSADRVQIPTANEPNT